MAEPMIVITGEQITRAYWAPERGPNPPADREAGDKLVDQMTLGELVHFFETHNAGPTYVLVKERVLTQLEKLPPRLGISQARQKALNALEVLRNSISRLNREVNDAQAS